MKCHTKTLSRLISKDIDIDEHINNISSCRLSFFEKLILCRGLKFSLHQHCSSKDIQASFEKAFWKLDPLIQDPEKKELASATLRSIALNYMAKKGPSPPKALLRALNNLKRRDDIIISKPDKGSGVVIMDKDEYLRLLCEASINDSTKFAHIDQHRPKSRGRPPNPSLSFTMEFEHEGSIPFLGTLITRCGNKLTTEVYRKPTDTGLLLHFDSHVDNRYKHGLVHTMVDQAYRLSSSLEAFSKECDKLHHLFKTALPEHIGEFHN